MNKKRIDAMIPLAMDILRENSVKILTNDGKLPSNYSGYIDSYGPTLRQSGLMQAVTFYGREDRDRKRINELIKLVLARAGFVQDNQVALVDLVKNESETSRLNSLILEAIVACKLAMRTFPKIKVQDQDK